ncbi:MAG: short-chain dehydrogenase/reductase [Actinomycetia bacterium]|jgi:NAD(P)-dependent dehydrogenase (short-subunit alcohol dehydrogenase family)|nr:short-chain dehydrogenase/reductase [Actinomycetes bacterium]
MSAGRGRCPMPDGADVPTVKGMTDKTALITGASRGLGLALATALAKDGWKLIINARGGADLSKAAQGLGAIALAGDVADPWHRDALIGAVEDAGGLDLLVNNASALGAVPLQTLDAYPLEQLEHTFQVNTLAPLALIQGLLPFLRERRGAILNISSDAAVEAYPTWGGYGATKAALDQLSKVLAAEELALSVWWVDPGEMRTRMLAEAMPGEDLSETPPPEDAAAALLRLLDTRAPSGRYRVADL